MAAEFRQTSEEEIEAVRKLMLQSFHAREDAPALNRALLSWKYYAHGPSWPGPRSYVLAEKETLLAHAAIWPLKLRLESGVRNGIGFCDWAASEEHRGIGLVLLKKLTTLAPFILVVGGAEITRQILPRVGYKPWADLPLYARVLRPFRQTLSRQSYSWREPMRLARNTAWSLAGLRPAGEWTAELSVPDDETLSLAHRGTGSIHDRDFLSFLLNCPQVSFRSIVLRKAGVPHGYAMASIVGGQARIADVRIDSQEQSDWDSVIAVVIKLLENERAACEVTALASVSCLQKALAGNGFRVREQRPLVVLDKEGRMSEGPVPQIGMLVDDSSFLHDAEHPFIT